MVTTTKKGNGTTYLSFIILSRTSSASLSILDNSPVDFKTLNFFGVKLHTLIEESSNPAANREESSDTSTEFKLNQNKARIPNQFLKYRLFKQLHLEKHQNLSLNEFEDFAPVTL